MSAVNTIARFASALFHPVANVRAAKEIAAYLWRYRALCWELTWRDLGSQFAGQALGRFWIVGHPLMLYVVYVLVFGLVLKVRIDPSVEMPRDYTTYILAGLIPWLSMQQGIARAPSALISQANLVKQVVFPIEVLPLGSVLVSLVPLLVGLALIVVRGLVGGFDLPWTLLLLPAAIALHLCFMLGLAFLLAAVTPFFRDLKDVVVALTVIGVYIVPAFYLPQWIPAMLRPWLYLNPFSHFVWIYQDVLYYGAIRHPFAWVISAVLAFAALSIGYRAFRTLKPQIANVL